MFAVNDNPPTTREYSEAIEDFLKAVYMLQQGQERVPTSALAETLKISPSSTSEMAKKLARANLVEHEPYRGVRLTPGGRRVALEIIRNHRLLELFLVRTLGYGWDEVHAEAERLEHAVSERLIQRIAEFLGHPRFDPHGDPIPDPHGDIHHRKLIPLAQWKTARKGRVARLSDQSPEMLRYLEDKGLTVGATVEVVKADPFDGPLTLRVNGKEQVIGVNVAQCVLLMPESEQTSRSQ